MTNAIKLMCALAGAALATAASAEYAKIELTGKDGCHLTSTQTTGDFRKPVKTKDFFLSKVVICGKTGESDAGELICPLRVLGYDCDGNVKYDKMFGAGQSETNELAAALSPDAVSKVLAAKLPFEVKDKRITVSAFDMGIIVITITDFSAWKSPSDGLDVVVKWPMANAEGLVRCGSHSGPLEAANSEMGAGKAPALQYDSANYRDSKAPEKFSLCFRLWSKDEGNRELADVVVNGAAKEDGSLESAVSFKSNPGNVAVEVPDRLWQFNGFNGFVVKVKYKGAVYEIREIVGAKSKPDGGKADSQDTEAMIDFLTPLPVKRAAEKPEEANKQ